MSRLATWADYGLAVALALCRRLRLPAKSEAALLQPAFEPAYACDACGCARPAGMSAALAPRWREEPPAREEPQRQPWFVRPAEVLMLSLSFFLAAHLVGGGTPEARAPQVSFALAAALPAPARVIEVRPSNAAAEAPAAPAAAEADDAAAAVEEPRPAPAPTTSNAAASSAPAPAASPAAPPAAREEPAAPPAPAPAPAIAPPAASQPPLTYAQVIAYAIEAGWPAELADSVARVAWCESRFRPDAVGYGAYGLMQVIPLWFDYAGLSFEQWADPVANLKAALAAFRYSEAQGHKPWSAWSCKPEAITIP
ncbi:transglycosylase SLT domain-containing protein [Tepidiforma flava]|uniref:Transglycosylase SLT domain-containing protein n=1 Tax=Tepidiforma flava TaxID=3004094 RepID=A0ABY7MA79_9CHLR|nr:transglycosylase SLT domain-containing protein [Tepidiforma flava]WBL37187.1 transglycosylase SLT domain-containing protein [Tepidiforma flava]